jgi:hypothetical protein
LRRRLSHTNPYLEHKNQRSVRGSVSLVGQILRKPIKEIGKTLTMDENTPIPHKG